MGPGCPITAGMHTIDTEARDALGSLSGPVRDWFAGAFPEGPTPAQRLAWPPIAAGEHILLVSPTGTGKTLAGFLAILDRLFRRHAEGTLSPGLRCVYRGSRGQTEFQVNLRLGLTPHNQCHSWLSPFPSLWISLASGKLTGYGFRGRFVKYHDP